MNDSSAMNDSSVMNDSNYQLRDGFYHLRGDNSNINNHSNRNTEENQSNANEDDFNESTEPQSEVVLFIARGVGLVVLVTALLLIILFLMFSRAVLAFLISKYGISGVSLFVGFLVWITIKYAKVSPYVIYNTFTRSCG